MTKSTKRWKFIALSLVSMMLMTTFNNVHAEESPETTSKKRGNISITLNDTEDHVSKENVVLGIVKIANENAGQYDLLEPYTNSGIEINYIETTAELNDAALQLVDFVDQPDLKITTDDNGTALAGDLEVGVYLIYPIELSSYDHITPIIIAIPTFDDDEGQMKYDIHLEPKHYPVLSNIQVKKVDANDETKVLKSASFTLYDENHNEIITLDTDKNGICTFEGYRRGTYYLKETAAPKGYRLSDKEIEVVIDENYDENHIYEISISNELLPFDHYDTGDSAPLSTYAMIGFTSIVVFTALVLKKKNNEKNIPS